WRTPLTVTDRLVLVCGATWRPDSEGEIHTILAATTSTALAEQQLSDVLGGERRASVLVIAPRVGAPHLRLLSPHESERHELVAGPPPHAPRRARLALRRWLFPGLGLLLLGLVALAALAISPHTVLPADRVDALSPRMAVRLGGAAADVVDLAAG